MRMDCAFLCLLAAAGPLAAQTFGYDAAGRLTRAVYPQGGGVSYQYDAADNLVSVASLSVPAAPTGVKVSRTADNAVQVSWNASPGAAGYQVERSLAGESDWQVVATLTANQTAYLDQTAASGQTYIYRVSALGTGGAGAYSAPASTANSSLGQPQISQNGVVNGASFDPNQPIAPGSIATIYGVNLGFNLVDGKVTALDSVAAPPLATTLDGYSVTIGGVPAPLYLVYGAGQNGVLTGQINAQVPWSTPLGAGVPVIVHRDAGDGPVDSAPQNVNVAGVSPALFTFNYGKGPAAVVNSGDGSIAQPAGSLPGVAAAPAKRGSIILIFATGLGPVTPPAQDGQGSLNTRTTTPARVFIGGVEAAVSFSGLSPQYPGLYQINAVIAGGTPAGDAIPIQVEVGGVMSQTNATVAIAP